MASHPRIRQFSLGELLDETFRFYRAHFLTFLAITALVLVPYQIINFFVQLPLQSRLAEFQPQPGNPANPFGAQSPTDVFSEVLFWYLGIIGVALLYFALFLPLLEGALAHAVSQRYFGNVTSVGESFGAALKRLPALIGARLLFLLIGIVLYAVFVGGATLIAVLLIAGVSNDSAAGTGLAILAGFIGVGLVILLSVAAFALYIRIFFASQVVMLEGRGPWSSLKRSWQLTHRFFWRTLGFVLIILLLLYFLATIPTLVALVPGMILGIDQRLQLAINTVVWTVVGVISTPFGVIAYTLMYYDLRVRKEGFDLQYQGETMFQPGAGYMPRTNL